MSFFRAAVLFVLTGLLSLVASPALAQDQLPLGVQFVVEGGELILEVQADDFLESLEVELVADTGGSWTFSERTLEERATWTMRVPAPTVTTTFTVTIRGLAQGEPGEMSFDFPVEVAGEVDFDVDTRTYDRDGHSFVMRVNQPVQEVEIRVTGDQGELLAQRVIPFDGAAANTPLTIEWSQGPGNVLAIDVKAVSTSGAWASRRYVPWYAEFEAIYVNFASGSAEIPESDFAMLETRLAEISAMAERVSPFVDVQLYVSGYTDTVGNPGDNQRLSEQRAEAIGRWVRSRGWDLPIFSQGFGEDVQAVSTGDGVDEPANRRALFILGTADFPVSSDVPRTNWRRLD